MYSVVILSANAENLLECVRSVVELEPRLPYNRIVIVNDGARKEQAESAMTWVEGKKPFVFARNANIGIHAAIAKFGGDVILLNDDALLSTRFGFTKLAQAAAERDFNGIYSAAVRGEVGNANQRPRFSNFLRFDSSMLAFICVYIPNKVFDRVGDLDERLVGYGYDDNDYCRRALNAGFELGILDACVVEHGLTQQSTYRSRASFSKLFDQNQRIYTNKLRAERAALTTCAGALRIKNEAAHIEEVITSILPLCNKVYVFDDHSTDATVAICRSLGDRVVVFESPFEGLDEARDKNWLLRKIAEDDPEWVLWIDGDEVLERSGVDTLQAAMLSGRSTVYALKIAYLWDEPHKVRVDGIWGRFWRPSLFRLRGQTTARFPTTVNGGNFHCGNVPLLSGNADRSGVTVEARLKHYGYLEKAHRMAKYAWYNANDPNNVVEDEYRHIAEIPGAKHAPGPARYETWRD